MRVATCVAVMIVAGVLSGCGVGDAKTTDKAVVAIQPPKEPVSTKIFEPVYRAGKSIQGATESGVTYVKFGELLQGLSTEISIAKDQTLTKADKELLALYEEAIGDYHASVVLWQMKINSGDDLWKGEIPVAFDGKRADPAIEKMISDFSLPLEDRVIQITGAKYQAIPGNSPQLIWTKGSAVLGKAASRFYGRQ